MNNLIKFLFAIFPISFLLLLPQASDHLEQIFAGGLLLISLLMYLAATKSASRLLRMAGTSYLFGMQLAFLVLIVCIFFPVGGFLAEPLYIAPTAENAQAILVMASGATESFTPNLSGYQRVLHGIKLLKENRAPLLLLSTGYSNDTGFAEAHWVASMTRLCEVPPEKVRILKSERIRTSKTEADYAVEQLRKMGLDTILLVTNTSHLYRGTLVFENLGINVLPAPCNSATGLYHDMGHNLKAFDATIHEWLGLVYYRLRNFY